MTYVALSGEQVQEYASKDDFPETGEINIIYVDRATSRQYT